MALPANLATGDLIDEPWVDAVLTELTQRPRGIVAWRQQADVNVTGTPTTLHSIAAPLTAGRMYRLSFAGRAAGGIAANGSMMVAVTSVPVIAGLNLNAYTPLLGGTPFGPGPSGTVIFTPPTTGTYTFTLAISSTANTTAYGGPGSPCWVEDIGPTIAAAP